jgi:hypothetical protein
LDVTTKSYETTVCPLFHSSASSWFVDAPQVRNEGAVADEVASVVTAVALWTSFTKLAETTFVSPAS